MKRTQQQPNLVVIVLDQLRYDSLGITSGQRVHTPNIDRLAESGAQFENAFNHLPTCCPSRQSLLTGLRPEELGAHWNYDITLPIPSISPERANWPGAMAERGYQSGYVGKWHVSPEFSPIEFGYDEYVSEDDYASFRNEKYPELIAPHDWMPGIDRVDRADAETHWFSAKAVDQISRFSADERPWHVRLDLVQPHLPCRPLPEFAELYDADKMIPWESFEEDFVGKPYIQQQQLNSWGIEDWTWDEWSVVVARYFGMISQVDHALGEVFRAIEDSGQRNETLVILTTDHGDMCGAHRMMDKHYVLYDDVLHVPLLAAWPGTIPPKKVIGEMVYNVLDLVPTLTDALGLPEMEVVGRSLWPLLVEEEADDSQPWRDHVVATFNGQQFGLYTQRAIRTMDRKYVWNATDVDELYNLADDPAELRNVVDDPRYASELTELRSTLYETLIREGDRQVDNDWVRRQLLQGSIR